MSNVDTEKALGYLTAFRDLLDEHHVVQERFPKTYFREDAWKILEEEVQKRLVTAREVVAAVDPRLATQFVPHSRGFGWPWHEVRTAAVQAIGVLEQSDTRQEILGTRGPTIAAARLHPWVWEASARLWDDGHRKMALQAAATAIEIQLKAKLGVDRSGAPLVTSAFSGSEATPTEPRLRFRDFDAGTENWTSAHEGAMHFGRGCMQRIRNLSTHQEEEPEEQIALEQLAALSVLARWVDDAEVVRA